MTTPTPPPLGPEESYEIAYAEAARSLQSQAGVLESLHSRAATILSGAAIATSFLGSEAFRPHHARSVWTWVAVGCFAGILAACGFALWPQFGWKFDVRAEEMIDNSIEGDKPPLTPTRLRRDLAIHMSRSHDHNRERMRWINWALQGAVILLLVEIGAWVWTLR